MEQLILSPKDNYSQVDDYLKKLKVKRIFLVCGNSINLLSIGDYFNSLPLRLNIEVVKFSQFSPNPTYDSVLLGLEAFKASCSDMIVAVGGGSAMDLAKCVKLFSSMPPASDYIHEKIEPNSLPFMAIPTTAGTGSEATRYSIIYYNGIKQTITDYSSIPEVVLMDPGLLNSLPTYHRKATMMDALSHAIESYWSVNSTKESKQYAFKAIRMVLLGMDEYLKNAPKGNAIMLEAAYVAGQAINITQTTAGHALSYKLTSLFGLAHGHAVALCLSGLWPFMLENTSLCQDSRGEEYLKGIFLEIAKAFGAQDERAAALRFNAILDSLDLGVPKPSDSDIITLTNSVNLDRLKNHPIRLDSKDIEGIYRQILKA